MLLYIAFVLFLSIFISRQTVVSMILINTLMYRQTQWYWVRFSMYLCLLVLSFPLFLRAETLDIGLSGIIFIYDEQPAALQLAVKTEDSLRLESFLLTDPNRFVIDIFKSITITKNTSRINSGIVKKIRIGSHPDKVRVVFDLEPQFKNIHISSSEKSKVEYTYTLEWSQEKSRNSSNTILSTTTPLRARSNKQHSASSGLNTEPVMQLEVMHPKTLLEVPVSTLPHPTHLYSTKEITAHVPQTVDLLTSEKVELIESSAVQSNTQVPNEVISKRVTSSTAPLLDTGELAEQTVETVAAEGTYEPSIDIQRLFADDTGTVLFSTLDVALLLALLFLLVLLLIHRRRNRRMASRSQYRFQVDAPETDDPFAILGCSREDSNEKIKAQYKHLLKVYHRDGLESHDIPEEVRRLSEEHLRKVKEAYQMLRTERGF